MTGNCQQPNPRQILQSIQQNISNNSGNIDSLQPTDKCFLIRQKPLDQTNVIMPEKTLTKSVKLICENHPLKTSRHKIRQMGSLHIDIPCCVSYQTASP